MSSDELRAMYIKLLAKAMYEPTKKDVHPSFISFIQQMSPVDASMFKKICEEERRPLMALMLVDERIAINEPNHYLTVLDNITAWTDFSYHEQVRSISNLERLGLIKGEAALPYPPEYYAEVKKTPQYINGIDSLTKDCEFYKIHETKGRIVITPLGESFFDICFGNIRE